MQTLSKKNRLAIEAIIDIAFNARPDPVQAKDITRRQGIPQRYLEQVMQQLVKAGILKGVRGPKGGYRLARERRRISVGDIVSVVNGLDTQGNGEGCCSELSQKVIDPIMGEIEQDVMNRLNAITVEELCNKAQSAGVASGVHKADFEI